MFRSGIKNTLKEGNNEHDTKLICARVARRVGKMVKRWGRECYLRHQMGVMEIDEGRKEACNMKEDRRVSGKGK